MGWEKRSQASSGDASQTLDQLLKAGELDNTQRGWTIGWLELENFSQRLQLKLAGNCHPDLAGWRFRIRRNEPARLVNEEATPDYSRINLDQSGHVGAITADQMIKHHDLLDDELMQRLMAGEKPPLTWRKCLYMHWMNHRGQPPAAVAPPADRR